MELKGTCCARHLRAHLVAGLLILCILVSLAAYGPIAAQEPIRVVASFSVLGDFVQNVGGNLVDLHVLVPAGGDPHTFEPSPADSVALAEAALVFEIGLGFETWLDELVAASGSTAQRVVVSDGLTLRRASDHHEEHEGEHEHEEPMATPAATAEGEHTHEHGETAEGEHAHEHGEFDPHVWLDVRNAMLMVGAIRDALTEADPANAESYNANASDYLAQLEALDATVVLAMTDIPEAHRELFTTHDAFSYFGARYGLHVESVLGITTEAADPAASQITGIIDEIRASGVPAIFAENAVNPALIEQIAREAGVALGARLYDVLDEPGTPGDTYLHMMAHNAQAIADALR